MLVIVEIKKKEPSCLDANIKKIVHFDPDLYCGLHWTTSINSHNLCDVNNGQPLIKFEYWKQVTRPVQTGFKIAVRTGL